MNIDELESQLRDLSALLDLPSGKVKPGKLNLCLAYISAVAEDDEADVPAKTFEAMSPQCRRLALGGLVALIAAAHAS
jgi:hypothetical protein